MVPFTTTLACTVTLFVSLFLPVILLVVFAWKNKGQGIFSAWFLGAGGFLVTQLLIRLPILSVLSTQEWFVNFSQEHPFWYALTLAFTAGLFELAGRYVVALSMRKNLTWKRSLAAGMGHGGIEAIFIVGMAYINNLVYITMIQNGAFDAMLTQVPAEQAAYLETIRQSLVDTSPALFLVAGFERALTMICHAAMSVIVCRGVATKKTGKALLTCLGLHTLIDLTAGISLLIGTKLTMFTGYAIIYAILIAVAALSWWILTRIRREWKEEIYDSQK